MRGLRYPVVVVILVVVLGILFGGQWLYSKFLLERPVVEALNMPEIESTKYVEETNTVFIKLKEVDNLKDTYVSILDKIQGNKNAGSLKLVITDNRNESLEEAFYNSQFAVHQAIMQGDFISMNEIISNIASEYKLDRYAVFIDSENIYIQFHQNGRNLYEIINREVPGKEGLTPPKGSDER